MGGLALSLISEYLLVRYQIIRLIIKKDWSKLYFSTMFYLIIFNVIVPYTFQTPNIWSQSSLSVGGLSLTYAKIMITEVSTYFCSPIKLAVLLAAEITSNSNTRSWEKGSQLINVANPQTHL